jgi:hypothetical protein
MRWLRTLPLVALGLLVSSGAFAMFRAADLVVVPVAAAIPGLNGSNWRTDVDIMNVDTTAIDVEIVLLQCCGLDNSAWFLNIANHLGGRKVEGFGHVDTKLAGIAPGASVRINDIIGTDFGLTSTKGTLLIFAYQAGTLMTTNPPGGVPKLIVVNSRSYSLGTDTSGNTLTYGQEIPGLPWYDYIDVGKKARGLDHAVFQGLEEDARYRTAVGVVNMSDPQTSLDVVLTLNASDGTQIGNTQYITLSPLAMDQYDQAIINLFGQTLDAAISGATLTASMDAYISGAAVPVPALMVYCSRIDNNTNDPVYLEQSFTKELPWDCVFNGNCTSVASALGLTRSPAAAPTHLRPPTSLSH